MSVAGTATSSRQGSSPRPHGGREMKEIARVHRRSGEVLPNRLQQHLDPPARDRNVRVRQRRSGQEVGEDGHGTCGDGERRSSRPGVGEDAASFAAPVAEAVVAVRRLRLDGDGCALGVESAPAPAHHAQQNPLGLRLADGEAAVCPHDLQPAHLAARTRPAHLDGARHVVRTQAEMKCRRTLGQVTGAEPHLLRLAARCGVHDHAGAYRPRG